MQWVKRSMRKTSWRGWKFWNCRGSPQITGTLVFPDRLECVCENKRPYLAKPNTFGEMVRAGEQISHSITHCNVLIMEKIIVWSREKQLERITGTVRFDLICIFILQLRINRMWSFSQKLQNFHLFCLQKRRVVARHLTDPMTQVLLCRPGVPISCVWRLFDLQCDAVCWSGC